MKVILPKFTNDQIAQTIAQDDVFYIPDHFPIPGIPTFIDDVISNENKTFLDICIKENPNKLFFFSAKPNYISDNITNVIFLPLYFIMQVFLYDQHGEWPVPSKNLRRYTACMIGGKDRWHRTLTSFWIANNLDTNNFAYTMKDNNNLTKIDLLLKKTKYKPINLHPKKFLPTKYIYDGQLPLRFSPSVSWSYNDAYFTHKHLYKITGNSYINLITESHSVELHGSLTENSLRSFVSGNIPLWLGTYQHNKTLRSMNFDVFGDIIDHKHLSTTDRCRMVLEGLEKNKFLMQEKEKLHDLYIKYHDRVLHNFHHALNLRGHILRYRSEIKQFTTEFNKSKLSYQQVDLDPKFIKFLKEEFS